MPYKSIPLPLATLIILTPVLAFWKAHVRLTEARQIEREQRLLTETAVLQARQIVPICTSSGDRRILDGPWMLES